MSASSHAHRYWTLAVLIVTLVTLLPARALAGEPAGPLYLSLGTVRPRDAEAWHVSPASRPQVTGLMPGGPADRAGLRVGDVVLELGRQDITTAQLFADAVKMQTAGAEVAVVVMRDGKRLTKTARMEAAVSDQECAAVYRRAAEAGDAWSQCQMAFCCLYGIGVKVDAREAVRWYRKAADQGYAPGQYSMGAAYQLGQGVEADNAEAVKWYRKAADQDHAEGQYSLARMYDNGSGVAKDYAEA